MASDLHPSSGKSGVEELTPLLPVNLLPHVTKMEEWSSKMHSWFWTPSFWLPGGVTWEQMSPKINKNYPNFSDILIYPIIFCFAFQFIRKMLLNPYILVPIAKKCGIKTTDRKNPIGNPLLQNLLAKNNGALTDKQINVAAKDLNWSRRKIERWIREKTLFTKPTKLDKFLYSSYLTIFHFFSIVLASFVLYDRPWVTDISQTIIGIPFHEVSSLNWWYYMLSTGFYCSVSLFSHHNGKVDFIHHVSTLTLLIFSWACNIVRGGTLVLFIHEFGDVTLQFGKMLDYLQFKNARNISIGLFTIVFGITRVVIFPFWIIRNVILEPPKHMSPPPSAYIFYTFLILLFIVNIYWCYLILFVVFRTLFKGEVLVDVRSESSATATDDDCDNKNNQK